MDQEMYQTNLHLASLPPVLGHFGDRTPRLFHYTTYAGLLGIVKSRTLWATNMHYLNDFEEFKHGLNIARRIAQRRASPEISDGERRLLTRLASVGEQYENANLFVSSFTEQGDILSQWRGYSSGGGASLGFIYSELLQIATKNNFRLIKCIYSDHEKEIIAEEHIDYALKALISVGDLSDEGIDRIAYGFMGRYIPIAGAFKHKAFVEEKEWRLISHLTDVHHPRINVRATNTMLIPYFEMDLCLGKDDKGRQIIGLEHVVVGPGREMKNISYAVWTACSRHEVRLNGTTFSTAPYRTL